MDHSNQVVVEMNFGSTVYGTKLPSSDEDYKFIFLPAARDLVMVRNSKNIQDNLKVSQGAKNKTGDVDREGFSVQEFIKHLTGGQTFAVDLLFTPENHYVYKNPVWGWVWDEIKSNKDRLISKKVQAFVGYCRTQAFKYSLKGDRVNAINAVVEFLESNIDRLGARAPVSHFSFALVQYCIDRGITAPVGYSSITNPRTGHQETYLEVCGRKANSGLALIDALKMYKAVQLEYGKRAQEAANLGGMDTKALYHALRITTEAEELLLTGRITFPRPEAPLLLNIRAGLLPYSEISELIDEALQRVENALTVSSLRDEPDQQFIEDFIYGLHLKIIREVL